VAAAGTPTLSEPANDGAGSLNKMLAVVVSICVAIFCVGAFAWRQSRSCLRKSREGNRGISDPDVVPAVKSGRGPGQSNSIAPQGGGVDECPSQPPLSSRIEPPLTSRIEVLGVRQLQLSPDEEEGGEAICGFGCCKMINPGLGSQPSSVQEVRKPPTLADARNQSTSSWRLKTELATFEGVWETPWSDRRPATETNGSNLLVVSYKYR